MIQKDTVKRNKHYRCLEYDADQDKDLYLIAYGKEQCDPLTVNGPDVRTGYHLHVILSGKGVLYAGGQEIHPHFGQMFLLKDQESVKYHADANDPWEYCWVTFNGRNAKQLVEDLGFTEGIYCVDSAIESYINLALEFIHFNYMSITVNDIIEYVGFTRSYFTTTFKEHVGVSPQKYLLQFRMKKACEQLESTDNTVKEIASSIGYENALTFSRSFKQVYGISPTDYRQNLLKEV